MLRYYGLLRRGTEQRKGLETKRRRKEEKKEWEG